MRVLLITQLLRSVGRLGLCKVVNHTSWVAVVTPTDRPKSVRNSCVIEVFGVVFKLSCCFLEFSLDVGALVMELSQISSFFSLYLYI